MEQKVLSASTCREGGNPASSINEQLAALGPGWKIVHLSSASAYDHRHNYLDSSVTVVVEKS